MIEQSQCAAAIFHDKETPTARSESGLEASSDVKVSVLLFRGIMVVISLRWFVGFCWIKTDWGSHCYSVSDWKHLELHAAWPQCSGRRHCFHCSISTWTIVLAMHPSAFYESQQFVALTEMSTAVIVTAVIHLSFVCVVGGRKLRF